MKDIDLFLSKVHQFAPGVSDPVAHEWICEAAIEFCERTRLWRSYDEFRVTDRQAQAIIAPAGAVIHEIERVDWNGQQLDPVSPADMDRLVPGWRNGSVLGNPMYYTQTETNTIVLAPVIGGKLTTWLVLKPAQGALELPDFLADQYRQNIADGALARILALPGKEYSNPDMAATLLALFQKKLAQLSGKGASGQQRAHPRSKPSNF